VAVIDSGAVATAERRVADEETSLRQKQVVAALQEDEDAQQEVGVQTPPRARRGDGDGERTIDSILGASAQKIQSIIEASGLPPPPSPVAEQDFSQVYGSNPVMTDEQARAEADALTREADAIGASTAAATAIDGGSDFDDDDADQPPTQAPLPAPPPVLALSPAPLPALSPALAMPSSFGLPSPTAPLPPLPPLPPSRAAPPPPKGKPPARPRQVISPEQLWGGVGAQSNAVMDTVPTHHHNSRIAERTRQQLQGSSPEREPARAAPSDLTIGERGGGRLSRNTAASASSLRRAGGYIAEGTALNSPFHNPLPKADLTAEAAKAKDAAKRVARGQGNGGRGDGKRRLAFERASGV
jgi:hypothetical protein